MVSALQAEDAGAGMAGSAGDPAALLRLYMRHSRLRDAAQLALRHLHAWRTQVKKRLHTCLTLDRSSLRILEPVMIMMMQIGAGEDAMLWVICAACQSHPC
jgi:hypothetical protein